MAPEQAAPELAALSRKMNVVISLLIRLLTGNQSFEKDQKGKKGTADIAVYLRGHDLSYEDIAGIIGSPIGSVREMVSRETRKGKPKK